MVDIIHTDAGIYGQPIATGTVDFWPNDGKTLQPGCPIRLGDPNGGIAMRMPNGEMKTISSQVHWPHYNSDWDGKV